MKASEEPSPVGQGNKATGKTSYHPPKLLSYGLIRGLTKGLSGTASEKSVLEMASMN
jgi:hypothetical protein